MLWYLKSLVTSVFIYKFNISSSTELDSLHFSLCDSCENCGTAKNTNIEWAKLHIREYFMINLRFGQCPIWLLNFSNDIQSMPDSNEYNYYKQCIIFQPSLQSVFAIRVVCFHVTIDGVLNKVLISSREHWLWSSCGSVLIVHHKIIMIFKKNR